jgi:hypothetical protein
MTAPIRAENIMRDDATIAREARRILRRLSEPGAVLAIAQDMEKAAVLRALPDGRTAHLGTVDRPVAQAFALKGWILCRKPGRVSSYELTGPGRAALRQLAEDRTARPGADEAGGDAGDAGQRIRYGAVESPIALLGRRRDKDGKPFLESALVDAAERLREDFELAQMGPRVAQNWDRFLTGGDRGSFRSDGGPADGPRAARERVAAALAELGPGLGGLDHLGQAVERGVFVGDEHWRHRHKIGDGRKVFESIKTRLAHMRRDGRRDGQQANGVAVGRRFGQGDQPRDAIAPGAVFHHHTLLEFVAQDVGRFAPDQIGRATRGKRHDQPDRLARPLLGPHRRLNTPQTHTQPKQTTHHVEPLKEPTAAFLREGSER